MVIPAHMARLVVVPDLLSCKWSPFNTQRSYCFIRLGLHVGKGMWIHSSVQAASGHTILLLLQTCQISTSCAHHQNV
jgi:hypothetical protein